VVYNNEFHLIYDQFEFTLIFSAELWEWLFSGSL